MKEIANANAGYLKRCFNPDWFALLFYSKTLKTRLPVTALL